MANEILDIANNAANVAAYNTVITLSEWLREKGHDDLADEMVATFIVQEDDGEQAEQADQEGETAPETESEE